MNQRILAYSALFLGVLALAFSPIFVSLAQVNGLAATLYRTSIAASVLLFPFLIPRDNRLGTETTPSRVSTILLIQPLLVLILAFIILQEQPSALQLAGMFTLFGGIVLANRR